VYLGRERVCVKHSTETAGDLEPFRGLMTQPSVGTTESSQTTGSTDESSAFISNAWLSNPNRTWKSLVWHFLKRLKKHKGEKNK
jgi:hypothetical protein